MNALYRDLNALVKKAEAEPLSNQKWRLHFHIMPPVGWLNDPNGLCQVNGVYHIFFQYAPFHADGGWKLWGHYTSETLVDWKYMGAPLLPDQPYDCHGVYSGSVLVEENIMHFFYTGNVKLQGDFNYLTNGRGSNTVYAYCKDGIHIEGKECLMTTQTYPSDLTCHVRDPKVWQENGVYYMVLGARTKEDVGQVLLYCSKDKKDWKLINRIMSKEKFGYMWECPDFFHLGKASILSVSPQGVEAQGKKYQNIYQSGYYLLDGDIASEYTLKEFKEWDNGFDFYAPQTFEDEKGRRLLIGWMGMADCDNEYTNPTVDFGWQHALTIPRVLELKGTRIYQQPVEEMKQLRKSESIFQNSISCASSFELFVDSIKEDCLIEIEKQVKIVFNKSEENFTLYFEGGIGYGRKSRAIDLNQCYNIRIFADTSSLEIFINDGEFVFTTRYYPVEDTVSVDVSCRGSINTIWMLRQFHVEKGRQ